MLSIKSIMLILFPFIFLFGLSACSGNPTSPAPMAGPSNPDFSKLESIDADAGNREVVATYDAIIDSNSGSFTITQERSAEYHFPLSKNFPSVLSITGYGFSPNLWADIKLTHPYPGSGIKGYDARVIAILPAKAGVAFYYPVLGVGANNAVLLEPDGYTMLFDDLGGSIPGNANPFMAYFKNQPYRVWSGTGVTSETRRWNMDLSGFGGTITFKLVVDVSTNYPDPPTPITDNAQEPVEIQAVFGEGLTVDNGGNTSIEATLLDWQGYEGIGDVVAECPALYDGLVNLDYVRSEGDQHIYRGVIANDNGAPEGTYNLLVRATDTASGKYIFDEFKVTVKGIHPDQDWEITPSCLRLFAPELVTTSGNYMYVIDQTFLAGLYILDISNTFTPRFINYIELPYGVTDIKVVNGYAYIATDSDGLVVYDVDPPDNIQLVKTVASNSLSSIAISGGYAYATCSGPGKLIIFDIDPIETASLVKTVAANSPSGISVANGYAYLADYNSGLTIIDVDPVESAYKVKSVPTLYRANDVCTQGGYAYVTDQNGGLHIVDVEPPASAYLVKSVPTISTSFKVQVSGDYTYVMEGTAGIQIIDINPPESASVVKSIDTPVSAWSVSLLDGIAYVVDWSSSILILDTSIPTTASVVKTVAKPTDSRDVHLYNDYLYVADGVNGLCVVNDESPETMYVIDTPGEARDVHVADGYAYVTDYNYGLQIFDVSNPDTVNLVKSVDTPGLATGVFAASGYACVADSASGLQIIDVSPPESASIVKTVATPGSASRVFVSGEYAYVTDSLGNLNIVDINPPGSAYIVKSVKVSDKVFDVKILNGYAYVGDQFNWEIAVVDVTPPESAYVVGSGSTTAKPFGFDIMNGYAYVGTSAGSVYILDIDPYEDINSINDILLEGQIYGVCVSDSYNVHIAGGYNGLRIFGVE
jgi:hypothetical protein